MRSRKSIVWVAIACAGVAWAESSPAPKERPGEESFFIDLPQHGVAVTHSGEMKLGAGPPGIALFQEPAIRNGLAILTKLRNAKGEVIGFGSELEVFPAGADLVTQDVTWETDWTLVIPGRGTLFLHEQERSGELGTKVLGPTLKTGEPWVGDWTTTSTVGPRPDGKGVIAGGSGEFTGATGWFEETIRLTKYTKEGAMFGTVELKVHRER